jgi:hypothetical protein
LEPSRLVTAILEYRYQWRNDSTIPPKPVPDNRKTRGI